jgi:phage host-nuclease inhibitor protein Gam
VKGMANGTHLRLLLDALHEHAIGERDHLTQCCSSGARDLRHGDVEVKMREQCTALHYRQAVAVCWLQVAGLQESVIDVRILFTK